MSDATKLIAKEIAHFIWSGTGSMIRHTGLLFVANRIVNALPNWLGWIAPWHKLKTALTLGGLEVGATTVSGMTSAAWDAVAPVSEGFMTPIINAFIARPLDYLQQKGLITLNNIVDPNATSWTHYLNPSNAFSGLGTFFGNQSNFIWNYWFGSAPTIPQRIQQGIDVAAEYAPKAGEAIAWGMEKGWNIGTSPLKIFDVIQVISDATGLPYAAVLGVFVATGALSIYGLKTLFSGNTATATATATAQGIASSTGNNVILQFGTNPALAIPMVPAPVQGPLPQQAPALPPVPPPQPARRWLGGLF